jgi:hypothetical protein
MDGNRQSMATGKQPGKYKEAGGENQTNNGILDLKPDRCVMAAQPVAADLLFLSLMWNIHLKTDINYLSIK